MISLRSRGVRKGGEHYRRDGHDCESNQGREEHQQAQLLPYSNPHFIDDMPCRVYSCGCTGRVAAVRCQWQDISSRFPPLHVPSHPVRDDGEKGTPTDVWLAYRILRSSISAWRLWDLEAGTLVREVGSVKVRSGQQVVRSFPNRQFDGILGKGVTEMGFGIQNDYSRGCSCVCFGIIAVQLQPRVLELILGSLSLSFSLSL